MPYLRSTLKLNKKAILTDACVYFHVGVLNQNAGYSREKYREEGIAQHVLDENAAVGFVGNFVADLAELNLPLLSMKHVHTVVDS